MKLLFFAFAALTLSGFGKEPPPILETGAVAPEFKLPGIDGETYTLESFSESQVLVITFTCNHCPDAMAARGRMRQIAEDYGDKGVAFVAINGNNPAGLRPDELSYSPWNDSFEEMTPFAKEAGWQFPYLYDGETQTVTQAYGAQATPHVFVFDEDRKLRYNGRMDDARRSEGPTEESYLRDAIDAILAGSDVDPATTRPFGCSTKWIWKKSEVAADQEGWEKKPVSMAPLDIELAKKIRANAGNNLRLINFWSTTCGPCMAEFPDLVETYRRFQNRQFDLITISMDPEPLAEKAEKFLKKQHAAIAGKTLKSLNEEGLEELNYRFSGRNPDLLADAIDPEWTGAQPHSVLISPGGELIWRHTGRIDPTELRKQILDALEELEGSES